jgi:hypothetical protein
MYTACLNLHQRQRSSDGLECGLLSRRIVGHICGVSRKQCVQEEDGYLQKAKKTDGANYTHVEGRKASIGVSCACSFSAHAVSRSDGCSV